VFASTSSVYSTLQSVEHVPYSTVRQCLSKKLTPHCRLFSPCSPLYSTYRSEISTCRCRIHQSVLKWRYCNADYSLPSLLYGTCVYPKSRASRRTAHDQSSHGFNDIMHRRCTVAAVRTRNIENRRMSHGQSRASRRANLGTVKMDPFLDATVFHPLLEG
jgi:hypothetical protein